ncbi:MAG TPA: acyltransferase [Thioploca sp.]|nr:acyltransferase [Thioploca sp.]
MSRSIKRWASKVLKWVAVGVNAVFVPWQRLWAHACLAAKIKTPLDPSVVVHGCPEIRGTGQISFGKNVDLYGELCLETRKQASISIADEVVLSRGIHIICYASVHIGTGSMIGEYCGIHDSNHDIGSDGLIRYAGQTGAAPIVIGSNVWIGRGATILTGVTIGDNAVIGANAVVTKDVPPHTLAVGVPARPVKQYGIKHQNDKDLL